MERSKQLGEKNEKDICIIGFDSLFNRFAVGIGT